MLRIKVNCLPNTKFIGFIDYNEPWQHFRRTSDEYVAYVIKTGEMFINIENKAYHLKEGDFFIIPKGKLHYGYKAAKCSYYFIHFEHEHIKAFNEKDTEVLLENIKKYWLASSTWEVLDDEHYYIYLPIVFNISKYKEISKIFHMLDEAIEEISYKALYYKVSISCTVNKILTIISKIYTGDIIDESLRTTNIRYDSIQELIRYLNDNYKKSINSKDISRATSSNYDYINRIFKQATNYTIFQYLTKLRIDKAKYLLEDKNLKFYEVGERVGYKNPYHFSKVFKKITGYTISDYVKIFRDKI